MIAGNTQDLAGQGKKGDKKIIMIARNIQDLAGQGKKGDKKIIMIARNIQDLAGQEGRQEDHHDSPKHTGRGRARRETRRSS